MSIPTIQRKPYGPEETAFIIVYADRCIDRGEVYHETLETEFNNRFSRSATWTYLRIKLKDLLKVYGVKELSLPDFERLENNAKTLGPSNHGLRSVKNSSMSAKPTPARDGAQECSETEAEYLSDREDDTDTTRSSPPSDRSSRPEGVIPKKASRRKRALSVDDDYRPGLKSSNLDKASSTRSSVSKKVKLSPKLNAPVEQQQATKTSRKVAREDGTAASSGNDDKSHTEEALGSPSTASVSAASKRAIIEISEDEAATTDPSPKKQKTCKFTLEEINQKVDACLGLCRVLVADQQSQPEEIIEHINQIVRTIKDTPGSMVENFAKDLDSQRALKVKYRTMAQKLVGFVDLTNGTEFPKVPPQKEVNQIWAAFYEHIVSTVGVNNIEPTPTPEGAGYLSRCAEEIAHGRIPDSQLKACVASLSDHLISPHAQQTLISALFCRWIFSSPEPMLKDMHSAGMMQLYNATMATEQRDHDGLPKVQHLDKVATKLLFEDPNFQAVKFNHRVSAFQTRFAQAKNIICAPSRIAARMKPEEFAADAVRLKQRLLLSPKEYRIHFVRPGTVFDAHYMQAYDDSNDVVSDVEAAGRKVALCVFPALVCREPDDVRVGAGVESALCKNKRFFPTFMEKTESAPVGGLSKAVVLVLDE
ncbi:hypothetical protein N0V94_007163 [Neodidymelliopsis sp. IMI 364377]|nr:hypothetical protein N0V94_007163 [Neodidymelliopsis sp. IMI 364377]